MKLNRIPLKERLERINEGYAGDEKYDISLITRLANIPITDYLEAFPFERRELLYMLGIEEEIAPHMTYREVAKQVETLYESEEDMSKAESALNILALPFNRYCEERERRQYHE